MLPVREIEISPIKGESIRFVAVGDTGFDGYRTSRIAKLIEKGFDDLYSTDLLRLLQDKDISIANLECPLITCYEPILKSGPNLSAPPEIVKILQRAKFDIVNLANNHIMDHGEAGLQETVSVCQKAGLNTVGVGVNIEAAYVPLFFKIRGRKIALLAFAEEEFSCATETTAGAAKLDIAVVGSIIQRTKKKSDLVIVSVHGGNEFYPIPSPRVQKWYRFMVECGAGAIIGHHPHTIQGIEIYKNVPIIYSLGNFIFPPNAKMPGCFYEGLITRLTIEGKRVRGVEIFPCKQLISESSLRIELLTQEATARFDKRFERLSQIASDSQLAREFWKCFCFDKKTPYFSALKATTMSLRPNLRSLKSAIKNTDIHQICCVFANFLNFWCRRNSTRKQNIARLRNLLICPAHYEVLGTIAEMERLQLKPSDEAWNEFEELIRDCRL